MDIVQQMYVKAQDLEERAQQTLCPEARKAYSAAINCFRQAGSSYQRMKDCSELAKNVYLDAALRFERSAILFESNGDIREELD